MCSGKDFGGLIKGVQGSITLPAGYNAFEGQLICPGPGKKCTIAYCVVSYLMKTLAEKSGYTEQGAKEVCIMRLIMTLPDVLSNKILSC